MLIRYGNDPQLSQFAVGCNTPDGGLFSNVSANIAKGYPRFKDGPRIDQPAIICGSGPSLADTVENIRALQNRGGKVFALNGTAKFLCSHDIKPDVQILVDPRPANVDFLESAWANEAWLASQCDPTLFEQCEKIGYPVKLWHPGIPGVENIIPAKQPLLIGGGITVGLSALCLIHAAGHREMHLFGYDSCHRENKGHAFRQDRNKDDELVDAVVDNRVFTCSIAMASQSAEWKRVSEMLIEEGCELHVHGDGLIPTLWRLERRKKALRVLNAVYDLGVSPPTYDFISFLAEAERHRLINGFDVIDVCFQPGPMHGFRNDDLPPDVETRKGMLWRVCVAMARLLPSVRNVTVMAEREAVAGHIFPVGWACDQPRSHYGAAYQKNAWPMLKASEYARRQVALRFSKPYATISLRSAAHWTERNSNVRAWIEVAGWLLLQNIQPVFVPDTESIGVDGRCIEFDAAAFDLDLRCALYEGAVINLGVNSGPMTVAAFLDCKYRIFNVGGGEEMCAGSDEFLKAHGYERGDQFGANGKLIWEKDTVDVILRELREFEVKPMETTSHGNS